MLPHSNTFKNRLLATLPQEDLQCLLSHLQPVSLRQRDIIYHAGAPIEQVYFIEQGVASVLTSMANGSMIEVGMIGIEGMVGIPAMLGAETSAQQVIIQIGGTALQMNVAPCKAAFDKSPALRRIMHRFTESIINLSAQTAACNRLHSIEQPATSTLPTRSGAGNRSRVPSSIVAESPFQSTNRPLVLAIDRLAAGCTSISSIRRLGTASRASGGCGCRRGWRSLSPTSSTAPAFG